MMFGRYRRKVPAAHRDLIAEHRLPKPDWFVGSADSAHGLSDREYARLLRNPTIQAEIAAVREKIDRRASP